MLLWGGPMATEPPTSPAATVFGQDPAVPTALMLDQRGGDPSSFRGLAELCRQAGALDEARQLYERVAELAPDDAMALALIEILNRRPSPRPPSPDTAWPTPFVRLLDFLPADAHAEIQAMTVEALPDFVASEVYRDGHGAVDPSRRVSSVLARLEAHSRRFRPHVVTAVDDYDIPAVLGIERAKLQRYELQVTCHGDGAFFKAHADSGKEFDRHRVISYVYYFHRSPKAFTGGGLRLFDASVESARYAQDAFTRIEPVGNSLVFFPSNTAHEVERVTVESGAMADGRFSLNGWILEEEA